jgi:uncharacterized protein (TIGR02246 family)
MHAPEETIRSFSTLLAAGDIEAMVDLYEPEAAFVPRPGTVVSGHEAIRESLRPFLAMRPRMSGDIARVVTAGDTALVANRWSLIGSGPDGEPVELSGVSADVLKRRENGTWGIVVDDPWGGAA